MEKKFFLWRRTQRVDGATVYGHIGTVVTRESKTRYTRTFIYSNLSLGLSRLVPFSASRPRRRAVLNKRGLCASTLC
jgi:hypothetical protein